MAKTFTEDEVRATFLKAFNKIRDPNRWCKGALAKKGNEVPTTPKSALAASFCSLGAVYATEASRNVKRAVIQRLAKGLPVNDFFGLPVSTSTDKVINFNDDRRTTHADIVEHWCRVGQKNGWIKTGG